MEGWMTVPKQDIDAALARLAEAFPQTFVLEKHRPHRPLKVGIAADIPARCPAVERRVLSVVLSVYTRRVMYLQSPAVHPRTDGLGAHGCRRAVAFERLPSGHVGADVFRKTLPVMPLNRWSSTASRREFWICRIRLTSIMEIVVE